MAATLSRMASTMSNILIFCRDPDGRQAICQHLIQQGHYRLFIAETEDLVLGLASLNEFQLVLLCDPEFIATAATLHAYLRENRRRTKVRVLPSLRGAVNYDHWRNMISNALRPAATSRPKLVKTHPRWRWKPDNAG